MGALIVSCSASPKAKPNATTPEGERKTPGQGADRGNPEAATREREKKHLSSPPSPSSKFSSSPSNFDYEAYVKKHKLEKRLGISASSPAKKTLPLSPTKKKEVEKILQKMAKEMQNEWKAKHQQAEKLYLQARKNYLLLRLKEAERQLKLSLEYSPNYLESRKLLRAVRFFSNRSPLLIFQALDLIQKERQLSQLHRLPYVQKLSKQAITHFQNQHYLRSKQLFEKVIQICTWLEKRQIAFWKEQKQQAQNYLQQIHKKLRKK